MTELVINRSRILQSKRQEISVVATARKRKLRELYAVVHSDVVPQFTHFSAESPTPTPAEVQFLEEHDITRGRNLTDSSIPTTTRRLLRSDGSRGSPSSLSIPEDPPADQPQLPSNGSCDGEGGETGSYTPRKEWVNGSDPEPHSNTQNVLQHGQTASIKEGVISPAGRGADPSDDKHEQGVFTNPVTADVMSDRPKPIVPSSQASGGVDLSRQDHELHDGSRAGSSGVDPKQAIPISEDDIGQLPGSFSHIPHSKHHKAATVHLPPREVQESHLRQVNQSIATHAARNLKDDRMAALSIELPPSHGARPADPVSSPSSTVEARSATTPGLHEASTDTSPDNEGLDYSGADGSKDRDETFSHTPPELLPPKEELLEREEHDRLLRAQMDISKAHILGSSPTAVDVQLRLEEEQAAAASTEMAQPADNGNNRSKRSDEHPTRTVLRETIQGLVSDGEVDEIVEELTPEAEKAPDLKTSPTTTMKAGVKTSQPEDASNLMDIDTAVTEEPGLEKTAPSIRSPLEPNTRAEPPLSATSPEPHTISPTQAPVHSAERMTTRVSSGAIRHKPVSEIIGEAPRNSRNSSLAKGDSSSNSTSVARPPSPSSPSSRGRSLVQRTKDRERSRLATVVFARHQSKKGPEGNALISEGGKQLSAQEHSDYFMPLILAQAYNSARGIQPLDSLLQSAHKTITTSNAYVPFHEHQTQKILRRIHSLQAADKWSFRQPKRAPEPNRPVAHWDELLKEMKWMRTDFREERKWKMAVARNMAYACAEWVAADSDDRRILQIKASPPVETDYEIKDATMHDAPSPSAEDIPQLTPDLIPSTEHDSPQEDFDDESGNNLLDAVAPATIFSLNDEDVIIGLRRSAATDKLLEELPMYGTPLSVPQSDLPTSEVDPDASWRRPALPLSKYVEGKITLAIEGPPRKRSRYEYEDESDEDEQVVFGTGRSKRSESSMMQVDVALFNPENKHIRDRIHAGHQFRPPSEHPMPLQSFFECRSSSHWLWSEDDELKALVREYSYNWQLISSLLSAKSLFASGAERRTPWECFERWIHLEGLPADMQKTHYFRAYNNRMESAARTLINQANQVPLSNNAAGAAVTPVRRRTTTSIRVDRKRNQKHLTLIDAMRKLAKKRETTAQKQLQAAGLAAMRKTNDAPAQQGTRHTPQDFSRLKHERELQMQERLQRMQLQQEAQRRALQQARVAQQQNPQQYSASNGIPQTSRSQAPGTTPGPTQHPVNANRPNHLGVPGQTLPQGPLQPLPNGIGQMPMPNGHGGVPAMPTKGVPQAQMQNMQGLQSLQSQHRLPVPNPGPDLRLVMQARQISEQQRQAVQMQQQQHQQQQQQGQQHTGHVGQIHNSPPNMRANMNGTNQQNFMQNNQAMMSGFNTSNPNGVPTPPANALQVPNNSSAGSPRMNPQNQQAHPNNNTVIDFNQLEAQYHTQFPNAPPEQIRKMVSDTLKQRHVQRQQISQSAMHAAAGNGGPLAGLPGGMQHSPQQYAQMLRAQQERQAQATQQNRSASVGSGVGK